MDFDNYILQLQNLLKPYVKCLFINNMQEVFWLKYENLNYTTLSITIL